MSDTRNSTKTYLILLRSKGLCFVCLRNCTDLSGGGQVKAIPPTFSLRNIIRFLEIETNDILNSYLNGELSRCENIKVELCAECSELVERVSSLYETLEQTKLKLNESVGKICELIGEAENDYGRVAEMKRRVTNVASAGIMEGLRSTVFEKCSKKLERSQPQVVLDEDCAPGSSVNMCANPTSFFQVQMKPEQLREPESGSSSVMMMTPADAFDDDGEEEESVSDPADLTNFSPSIPSGGKEFYCPYCRCQRSMGHGGCNQRAHMVRCHCHHYFREHKLPSISEEKFEAIVDRLLFKDMLVTEGSRQQCSLCPKTYTTSNRVEFLVKAHAIESHFAVLLPRLSKLQRDPDVDRKLKMEGPQSKRRPFVRKPKTFQQQQQQQSSSKAIPTKEFESKINCPHCKFVITSKISAFQAKWNFTIHSIRHHLETYFQPEEFKAASLSDLQFKQILYHFLFDELYSNSVSKCPCCPRQFVVQNGNQILTFKMHLMKMHQGFMGQRLRQLQRDPAILRKLEELPLGIMCPCGAYLGGRKTYNTHQREFCKLEVEGGGDNLQDTSWSGGSLWDWEETTTPGPSNTRGGTADTQPLSRAKCEGCGKMVSMEKVAEHMRSCPGGGGGSGGGVAMDMEFGDDGNATSWGEVEQTTGPVSFSWVG